MRRFSILNLMGLVLVVAVAFAALRSVNQWWAGGVLLATLALIGFSLLAALLGRGRRRAAWLGFLVMAGGYFVAIRTLPEQEAVLLPTVQLLQYVQARVGVGQVFTVAFSPQGTLNTVGTGSATFELTTTAGSTAAPPQVRIWDASGSPSWAALLPGAANGAAFRSIGHNLFALLFGLVGSVVSGAIRAREVARSSRPRWGPAGNPVTWLETAASAWYADPYDPDRTEPPGDSEPK